jgi:hypothetical protein
MHALTLSLNGKRHDLRSLYASNMASNQGMCYTVYASNMASNQGMCYTVLAVPRP